VYNKRGKKQKPGGADVIKVLFYVNKLIQVYFYFFNQGFSGLPALDQFSLKKQP